MVTARHWMRPGAREETTCYFPHFAFRARERAGESTAGRNAPQLFRKMYFAVKYGGKYRATALFSPFLSLGLSKTWRFVGIVNTSNNCCYFQSTLLMTRAELKKKGGEATLYGNFARELSNEAEKPSLSCENSYK